MSCFINTTFNFDDIKSYINDDNKIGSGVQGIIYNYKDNLIIKKYNGQIRYLDLLEIDFLLKLKNYKNVIHLYGFCFGPENEMYFVFDKLYKIYYINNYNDIEDLRVVLNILSQLGILYNDLHINNLMRDSNNNIVLIDFGSISFDLEFYNKINVNPYGIINTNNIRSFHRFLKRNIGIEEERKYATEYVPKYLHRYIDNEYEKEIKEFIYIITDKLIDIPNKKTNYDENLVTNLILFNELIVNNFPNEIYIKNNNIYLLIMINCLLRVGEVVSKDVILILDNILRYIFNFERNRYPNQIIDIEYIYIFEKLNYQFIDLDLYPTLISIIFLQSSNSPLFDRRTKILNGETIPKLKGFDYDDEYESLLEQEKSQLLTYNKLIKYALKNNPEIFLNPPNEWVKLLDNLNLE